MKPSAKPLWIPVDMNGRLEADVVCWRCGYNLRGQPREGRCSECDATVEPSIPYFHQFNDVVWLRRMHKAAWRAVAAVFTGVAVALMLWGISFLYWYYERHWAGPTVEYFVVMLVVALCAVPLVMLASAAWGFASPTMVPGAVLARHYNAARVMLRVGAVFYVVFAGTQTLIGMVFSWSNLNPDWYWGFLIFTNLTLLGLSFIAAWVGAGLCAGALARRLHWRRLAWNSVVVGCGLASVGAAYLGLLAFLAIVLTFDLHPGILQLPAMLGGIYMMIGLPGFGLWALVLIFLHARMLGRTLKQAQRYAEMTAEAADANSFSQPQPAH